MKTFSEKSSSKDTLTRNRQGTNHKQVPVKKSVPAFSGSIPLIQRKSICPCDGGCPRCTNGGTIQPKLTIGLPNDKYEQEADRVADQIMRMPEPGGSLVQRKAGCSGCMDEEEEVIHTKPIADQITPLVQRQAESEIEEEEEEPVQLKSSTDKSPPMTAGLQSQIQSMRGGGQALPESTRTFFESRFGQDFSQVRVHTDTKASAVAKKVNAQAFTTGKDVVFGAGKYVPGTNTGKRLLAHELTHVLQQDNISSKGVIQKHPNSTCSKKAENAAEKAEELRNQEDPCIWFDTWHKDRRDNNLYDPNTGKRNKQILIDENDPVESKYKDISIGVHQADYLSAICKNDKRLRIDDSGCVEEKVKVKYKVCIDIPIYAYKKAKIYFPHVGRSVVSTIDRLKIESRKKQTGTCAWKMLMDDGKNVNNFDGTLKAGDFVALKHLPPRTGGHSGIVFNQSKIIDLPGAQEPSKRNDIKKRSPKNWGYKYVFRYIDPSSPNIPPGGKHTCVPSDYILMSGQPRKAVKEEKLPPGDLVGIKYNDGITYGTWDLRPRVERLQIKLIEHGAVLKTDGMFGNETGAALRQFQASMGLPEQEIVDPATAEALDRYGTEPGEPSPISRIEGLKLNDGITYGTWDRRPRVRELQTRLTASGFFCEVDGMFGSKTTDALHGFQGANGLPQRDIVDRDTADALEGRKRGGTVPQCPPGYVPVAAEA